MYHLLISKHATSTMDQVFYSKIKPQKIKDIEKGVLSHRAVSSLWDHEPP